MRRQGIAPPGLPAADTACRLLRHTCSNSERPSRLSAEPPGNMADRAFSRSQTMSTNWADDVEEDEELERGEHPPACCAAAAAGDAPAKSRMNSGIERFRCASSHCMSLPSLLRHAVFAAAHAALAPPCPHPLHCCSGVAACGLAAWPAPGSAPSADQPHGCTAAAPARAAAHAAPRRRRV